MLDRSVMYVPIPKQKTSLGKKRHLMHKLAKKGIYSERSRKEQRREENRNANRKDDQER